MDEIIGWSLWKEGTSEVLRTGFVSDVNLESIDDSYVERNFNLLFGTDQRTPYVLAFCSSNWVKKFKVSFEQQTTYFIDEILDTDTTVSID